MTFTATVTVDERAVGRPHDRRHGHLHGRRHQPRRPVLDASGQATLTTSRSPSARTPITATYGGATGLAGSDDSLDQVVTTPTRATALTSSLNPSTFGQTVTFTATVTIPERAGRREPGDRRHGHVHRRRDRPRRTGRPRRRRPGDAHDATARRRHPRDHRRATAARPASHEQRPRCSTRWSTAWPTPAGRTRSREGDAAHPRRHRLARRPRRHVLVGRQRRRHVRRRHRRHADADVGRPRGPRARRRPRCRTRSPCGSPTSSRSRRSTPLTIANVAPTATFDNDGPVAEGATGDRDLQRPGRPVGAGPRPRSPTATTSTTTAPSRWLDSASPSAAVPARSSPTARPRTPSTDVIADDDGGSSTSRPTSPSPTPRRRPPSPGRPRRPSACR